MNVRDSSGNIVGFRCSDCGDVVQSMMGNTCNHCRGEDERAKALVLEIRGLREELAKLRKEQEGEKK